MKVTFLAAILITSTATPTLAVIVPISSYDMPNGDSGTYSYWDKGYSGVGSTTSNGALLSGGTGDLTDGYEAPAPWFVVENVAGTGPFVGWGVTINPVIAFNFTGNPTITSLSLHIDNTGVGGVNAPSAIFIDGIDTAFTAPALGTIGWIDFSGLNLIGSSHTLQFNQAGGGWVFISEIIFSSNVPEPTIWAMMLAGFGLIGVTLRRRRPVAA